MVSKIGSRTIPFNHVHVLMEYRAWNAVLFPEVSFQVENCVGIMSNENELLRLVLTE